MATSTARFRLNGKGAGPSVCPANSGAANNAIQVGLIW
jgi:hypothetical protein